MSTMHLPLLSPFSLLFLILVWVSCVSCLPEGPPTSVCSSLAPNHPNGIRVTSNNGGFLITTNMTINGDNTAYVYASGQAYTVTLGGSTTFQFQGFAVQSLSVPSNQPIGSFIPQNTQQQILNCVPNELNFTIVHYNPSRLNFFTQQFIWIAPDSPTAGSVDFWYTVVKSVNSEYYVRLSGITQFLASQTQEGATSEMQNIAESTTEERAITPSGSSIAPSGSSIAPSGSSTAPSGSPTLMPSTSPADYPLVFKSPSDCAVSDCTVYVGIEGNEGNLNFYIEGDAAAWVAVGFSLTRSMRDADVLACNRVDGGEEVEVLDTWNQGYSNVVDDDQDIIMLSSSVKDGRIFCSFGCSIAGTGDEQDVDLDGDYYVLFGVSNGMTSSGSLVSHRTSSPPSNPSISEEQFSIASDAEAMQLRDGAAEGISTSLYVAEMFLAFCMLLY